MLPRQDRFIYVAGASLVAIASSVEAKSKGSSQKTSKPASTSGGGGSTCYDGDGNQITCPLSKTEYIVIGVLGGIVVLVVLASVLCCVVRKSRQRLALKKKDAKGAHQKLPSEEDPLYHNQANPFDSDEKQPGEMAEGEKLHYSTPYDPVYPIQHYDHQLSDSASIASSLYNVPPVTAAQPQDYSNQYYYNTNITAPPRMYAPTPHHPSTDV